MPHKDPETRREYQKQWSKRNRDRVNQYQRKWREKHKHRKKALEARE